MQYVLERAENALPAMTYPSPPRTRSHARENVDDASDSASDDSVSSGEGGGCNTHAQVQQLPLQHRRVKPVMTPQMKKVLPHLMMKMKMNGR